MLLGTDLPALNTTLNALGVDILGLNCSTGPEDMRDAIRYLGEHSPVPLHCIPNAGIPHQGPNGETIFPEEPGPLAETLGDYVERYGVGIVGGCCGTTPDHIRALRERVGRERKPAPRPEPGEVLVSSMITATPLAQEPAPTLVGERVNSQGSRKAKELLLADDYDGLLQIAEDQVNGGAHVLDLCVALTERQDEDEQMSEVASRVSLTQPAPIQIDSTEPDVIKDALEHIPGRAIVNSINLEAGRDKADVVVPLAVAHGAALIALTIDEVGMAKTAERKVEIAKRIKEIACEEHGLDPRAADLRRAHLHPDHRRRRVEAVGGRDDRGHPPDQGRDPRGEDVAGRLERLLRRLAPGPGGAQLGLPASLRRGRARPGDGESEPHHPVRRDRRRRARARRRPRLQPPRGRARALHRPLRVEGARGRGRGGGPDRRHGAGGGPALAHPAAQEGGGRGLGRPLGREDRRRPDPEPGAAAGDEGGRRQVRRRRADPAVRAPVGRGDEAGGRQARELPRSDRGTYEGQGRDRDRVRRRPRHRQVARQHDPDQQRLHGRRPRQAGPGRPDHQRRDRTARRRDRALGAARLDLEADAPLHRRAAPARARVPGADRRRRDQPRLRPPGALSARQGVGRGLRAGGLLLQGRVRRARHGRHARRRRGPRGAGRADPRGGARAARAAGRRGHRPADHRRHGALRGAHRQPGSRAAVLGRA